MHTRKMGAALQLGVLTCLNTAFLVIAALAIGFQSLLLYLAFFGPDLPYQVNRPPNAPPHSRRFGSLLATLTDAQQHDGNRIEVLTNGNCFYPAALEAISRATTTINLEAFIFEKGEIAAQYRDALTERARAGVKVRLILDFLGCLGMTRHYFRDMLNAGGRLEWYHGLKLDLLPQMNNRTHRELLIIDGKTAFIGGPGIADQWYKDHPKKPRWRDTVTRVEGPAVTSLQSVFAENWLRVAGEILTGDDDFPENANGAGSSAMVINSTPAAGSTRARILYQVLIASACKCIYITTPYFLPDRSARRAVRAAARDRNVEVKILTPGKYADHKLTRSSSRHLYGSLLKAGARIYEYNPAMIHAKVMIVDDCWSVVGSTNFDHRSFELNDEVNLAICDPRVAARLSEDFARDLAQSTEMTYRRWRKRPDFLLAEWLGALLEKQS